MEPVVNKLIRKQPYIIEIVGVAGAGKSSLREALTKKNPRIRVQPPPSKFSYLPTFAKFAFTWLPLYLTKYRQTKWFTLMQTRNIGYLDTWISTIRSHNRSEEAIVIIDPGAVYWLSDLGELGPEITKHPRFRQWWEAKLEQWCAALDVIIWLDAPEELCVERVMTREEYHHIKTFTFEKGVQELKRFREEYRRIIPLMTSRHPIKVFYFRSDQITTDQMIEQIFSDPDMKWISANTHEPAN